MTENCTRNIASDGIINPDSITGMIFASEGVRGAVTLLNGPMGCKFYHSTTSQFLMDRPPLYLPAGPKGRKTPVSYQFYDSWFFRQSQVPCTWLDGEDYIYGTADQVRDALVYLRENLAFSLLVLINAPGASLIGDSLEEMAHGILPAARIIVLESPGYSEHFCDGYSLAAEEILRQGFLAEWKKAGERKETAREGRKKGTSPSVNLFGLSIWQRYFEGDREELTRLLELMGIRVNCVMAAGCDAEEIGRIPEADLNIVLYPERGLTSAAMLNRELGMPYYVCRKLPVGFDAAEQMAEDVAGRLGVSADPVLAESEKARARAFSRIRPVHEISGLPEGTLFSIEGNSSEVFSYAAFLQEYLGMIPDVLSVTEGNSSADAETETEAVRAALCGSMTETAAELVFGNANAIAMLKTRTEAFCGIEISNPGMGYTDFVPKTHLGIRGALFLIEQVINGLMSRL